ncbi:MAG: WD40/YVTN/BNR-like repeat-containing protein [Geminicoccales bacterium]
MLRQVLTVLVTFLSFLLVLAEVQAAEIERESRHVLKGRIIRSLAIDPGDPHHALVGQKGAKQGSALVFQTLDGGKTWRTLNGNRPLGPKAMDVQAVAALSKDILLAGTWKHGLYRSKDGGRDFVRLTSFPSLDIRDLQIADDVIYAATGQEGVFASSDIGETWQALGSGKDFLWSLTADEGRLFANSPEAGVFEKRGASWSKVFTSDKAYASAVHSSGNAWQAVAGETGLYAGSENNWRKIVPDDKFADVLIIDQTHLLAASWSRGVSVVTADGAVQKRLVENLPAIHLQRTDDQLFIGTWGKGLHILPWSSVLP